MIHDRIHTLTKDSVESGCRRERSRDPCRSLSHPGHLDPDQMNAFGSLMSSNAFRCWVKEADAGRRQIPSAQEIDPKISFYFCRFVIQRFKILEICCLIILMYFNVINCDCVCPTGTRNRIKRWSNYIMNDRTSYFLQFSSISYRSLSVCLGLVRGWDINSTKSAISSWQVVQDSSFYLSFVQMFAAAVN